MATTKVHRVWRLTSTLLGATAKSFDDFVAIADSRGVFASLSLPRFLGVVRLSQLCQKDPTRRSSLFLSSFFFTKLAGVDGHQDLNYKGVREWTRRYVGCPDCSVCSVRVSEDSCSCVFERPLAKRLYGSRRQRRRSFVRESSIAVAGNPNQTELSTVQALGTLRSNCCVGLN